MTQPLISVLSPSIRPAGLVPVMASLEKQTFQKFEWIQEIGCPWHGHDLNAAMNRMLCRAKGELVVIVQDYITFPSFALGEMWTEHEAEPLAFTTYPMGKLQKDGTIKYDWRYGGEYRRIAGFEWETDFAMAPLEMFKAIGGYDELYDAGWSWDNASVGIRGELAGYVPACRPDILAAAVDHDALFAHPFRGKNENGDLHQRREKVYREGGWKLHYL